MDPLIVVGGGAGPATTALVDSLSGHLIVWDERDVDGHWTDRPNTTEVRALPGPAWLAAHVSPKVGDRATTAKVRSILRRHRRADVVLVGAVSLLATPWLVGHGRRRIWLPTVDDLPAITGGLTIAPVAEGGPNLTVVVDDLAAHRDELAPSADDRWRWEPGWVAHADAASPASPRRDHAPELVVHGPPTRANGIDLVGRALAASRPELLARAGRVRWLAPPGTAIATEELDDLRRAHVDHLIDVVSTADPAGHPSVPVAAALILPNREPASLVADLAPGRAFRGGARLVATDRYPEPLPGLDRRWDTVPFGDARAMGRALVDALDGGTAGLAPGPVGIDTLLDLVPPA